jgi:hypothetical protein
MHVLVERYPRQFNMLDELEGILISHSSPETAQSVRQSFSGMRRNDPRYRLKIVGPSETNWIVFLDELNESLRIDDVKVFFRRYYGGLVDKMDVWSRKHLPVIDHNGVERILGKTDSPGVRYEHKVFASDGLRIRSMVFDDMGYLGSAINAVRTAQDRYRDTIDPSVRLCRRKMEHLHG